MRDTTPRPRIWVLVLTAALGVLTAVLLAAGMNPAELTFAVVNEQAQAAMSVLTPLVGILLVNDRRRSPDPGRLGTCLVAAMVTAAGIAVFGTIVSAATAAIAATGGSMWEHAIVAALGGVLVQIVASLVGTGFGLLIQRTLFAFCSTLVFPMGLWLLASVEALRPALLWLAPYEINRQLLSGDMSALAWAQWGVIVLIWGVGLNAVGAAWEKRRRS